MYVRTFRVIAVLIATISPCILASQVDAGTAQQVDGIVFVYTSPDAPETWVGDFGNRGMLDVWERGNGIWRHLGSYRNSWQVMVFGTATTEEINCSFVPASIGCIIFGGGGADDIYGGEGADIIVGGNGNDWLVGNGGNDQLNGGASGIGCTEVTERMSCSVAMETTISTGPMTPSMTL